MRAALRKHQLFLAVAALTVLAGGLRFTNLGLQSLWIDEAQTAFALRPSLSDTFENIRGREATPPLYYVITWVWTRLFGEGDVALRFLPALFGTATVPAVYLAGARMASRGAGIGAAALVATSPYLIWYSQEARAYALAMLLAALSLLFLAGAERRDSRRDLWLWALTCALLLATHYFTLVLVAAEALWLLFRRGWRDRGALLALAVPSLALAALVPLARDQGGGRTAWIADLGLPSRLDETARFFLGGVDGAPDTARGLATWLLAGTGAALLLWRARGDERQGGRLALGLAAVAVAASLALAAVGSDYVLHRNLLVLWIPLAVAVGAGFAAVRPAGPVMGALLCAVFLSIQITTVRDSDRHRADWESAVEAVGRSATPRPVVVAPAYAEAAVAHYGIPARDRPGTTTSTREIAVIAEGIDAGRLAPGLRVGEFEVAERHRHRLVTSAILRSETPQEVQLGRVGGQDYGVPEVNVLLDAGEVD